MMHQITTRGKYRHGRETAGQDATRHPNPSLQLPNGEVIPWLGAALYPFPWQTASVKTGKGGDRGISESPGRRPPCCAEHPEPGFEWNSPPVSACSGNRRAVV